MAGGMAGGMASDDFDAVFDGEAVSRARLRAALLFVMTLVVILGLAAVTWLQVSERFDTSRIRTEGETVRNAMTGMLSMGLPLQDFIGFEAVAARVVQSNPSIRTIIVRDRGGAVVLASPQPPGGVASLPAALANATAVDRVDGASRLTMPIVNRFGPAGALELIYERSPLGDLTRNAALAGLAAVILLAVGVVVHGLAIANPEFFQSRFELVAGYAVATTIGIALTASALAGLAAEKAEETAGAYAYSLGARLGEAVSLGISPDDLSGLDEVVREYQESNSVIGYVALLEGNRIAAVAGLDPAEVRWQHPSGYFDALHEVRPRRLYTPQYRVAVGIRWAVAMRQLYEAATVPAAITIVLLVVGSVLMARLRVRERE